MTVDIQKLKALAEAAIVPRSTFGAGIPYRQAFRDSANPAAVLELIAENERLASRVKLLEGYEAEFVRIANDAEAERDQLKAENTDLHATLQAAKGEIERLKGENEALRKDAERYRWLRKNTSVILDRKTSYQAETGFIKFDTMPARSEMQTAIDAAISKEASHD